MLAEKLTKELACVDGFESFWAVSREKKGYSGVPSAPIKGKRQGILFKVLQRGSRPANGSSRAGRGDIPLGGTPANPEGLLLRRRCHAHQGPLLAARGNGGLPRA